MSSIPEGLLYTKEHEWVSAIENIYIIGITDYSQAALCDIFYVQLPKVGDQTIAGTVCGEIESTIGRRAADAGDRAGDDGAAADDPAG